jgi:Flp pilus assembly protein TadG
MKTQWQDQTGVAAVEFALVLPLLVMLAMGIIEFSLLLYDKAMITNASREGARAGIVAQNPRVSDDDITTVVGNYCKDYLITFGEKVDPTTQIVRAGESFGDDLTVTVSYPYQFLVFPQFVTGLTGPIDLTAKTVMRME